MSGRTLATVGAGILIGAAVFFSGGTALAVLQGFAIGAAAAGLLLGPEKQQGELKPEELKITNSTEAQVIPVGFGTFRLAGNHIGYDRASFRSKEIKSDQGGKGGGGEQTTGYHYFLTYAVGLCMGEVDELVRVQGSPGEENVLWQEVTIATAGNYTFTTADDRVTSSAGEFSGVEIGMEVVIIDAGGFVSGSPGPNDGRYTVSDVAGDGSWIELAEGAPANDTDSTNARFFSVQDPIDLSAGAQTIALSGDREDQGSVTLYPGDFTQTGYTIDSIEYNHRGVCFAHFNGYQMGQSPAPRTYLFTLRRMPKVLDSGGSAVAGFFTRASKTSTDPEYQDANPAAIVWELLTNDLWGKGMSADELNEQDFIDASDYFATYRLGISTAIAGQSGAEALIDQIRDLFGMVIWDDGNEIRCKALWDRTKAYGGARARLTDQDIVGSPRFGRRTLAGSHNEVKLTFTNRVNNHQQEAVSAMDLGAVAQLGQIRTKKVDGSIIGTRRTAELLTHRLLRVLAYPTALCQVQLRRTFAGLEPGEFVELVWDGWRPTGVFTSFWRVDTVDDEETDGNEVTVTLVEDIYATARDGEISSFADPIITIEDDQPLEDGSFGEEPYQLSSDFGTLTPVLAAEPNSWLSGLNRLLVAAVQRRNGGVQSFTVGFADAGALDYSSLGVLASFAITGTIDRELGGSESLVIRQTYQYLDITLNEEAIDGADLLAAASSVQLPADDLETLLASPQAVMVIGREIIRCGFIEESGGQYTLKVAMRAQFGTERETHASGSTFYFFETFQLASQALVATGLFIDQATKIRISPYGPNASGDPTIIDGPDSLGFGGQSIEPLTPAIYEATRSSLDWTIKIRPRINTGWNSQPTLAGNLALRELSLAGMLLEIESSAGDLYRLPEYFSSGSETVGDMEVTRCEWIPTDGTDPDATGLVIIELTFGSNPASVDVRQSFNGIPGAALTVLQPT